MAEVLDFDEMEENCDSAEQAIMKAEELLTEKEDAASRGARRSRDEQNRLVGKYDIAKLRG